MKPIFLLLFMLTGLSMSLTAQNFEHFKVDMTAETWSLTSVASEIQESGATSFANHPYLHIFGMVKNTVKGLPDSIKNGLSQQKNLRLYFTFNAQGEIYNILFRGDKRDGVPLTDKQWLKVFDSLRNLKPYIAKLITRENASWEVRGVYPLSQCLQEAANN